MKKHLFNILNAVNAISKLNVIKEIMKKIGVSDPNEAVHMEISAIPKWTEKDGVIRFSVTSDGTTGEQWIARLESRGFVGEYAKSTLRSKDFKPTSAITYEIVVLKGRFLRDSYRVANGHHHFEEPNEEVICLMREKFSDKELETMGLYWLIEMDSLRNDYVDDPDFLISDRIDDYPSLEYYYDSDSPGYTFDNQHIGFAFVVS